MGGMDGATKHTLGEWGGADATLNRRACLLLTSGQAELGWQHACA